MSAFRACFLLACCALAACATPRAPAGLAMPGTQEGPAATLLAAYLVGRGWTVNVSDGTLVTAERGAEQVRLEPLLDPAGLDRLMVWRSWPAAAGVEQAELEAFALELNATLNVGQFEAVPGQILYLSSLPFLDVLQPELLDEFLAFTGQVRLALDQVQGERRLLAPVESAAPNR